MKALIYKNGLDDGSQGEIPTIGMAILAKELMSIGYDVTIYDGHFQKLPEIDIMDLITASDIVCFSLVSQEWELEETQWAIDIAHALQKTVLLGGPHAYGYSDILQADRRINQIVTGEIDNKIHETLLLESGTDCKVAHMGRAPQLSFPDFSGLIGKEDIFGYPLYTSRGCTNLCLAGDTIIHTIEGDSPITSLVGKEIKVLSRNPETQEPIYSQAINIRKTQEMASVVRVHFDDGTHIDCTPDHRFKVFSYKNQINPNEQEWDVEAKNLRPKQQVRAVMFQELHGRTSILTRRKIRRLRSRLVMEGMLGRKLEQGEWVHHKNHDKTNDHPLNLELTKDTLHIPECHPEVSERMRTNNAAKNMTVEQRRENAKKNIGKKRTLESRLRYRESKLGNKNPNYIENGVHIIQKSRIPEVNHKVTRVEYLNRKEDVYCMEIPGIEWFYANKVLVHNCNFCMGGKIHRGWRKRPLDNMFWEEVNNLKQFPKLKRVYIIDDCFSADLDHAKEFLARWFIKGYSDKYELKIMNVRADQIDSELLSLMKMCKVDELPIGVESADPEVFRHVGKGETLEDIRKAIAMIQDAGITPWLNMIVGLPHDNPERHQNSLNWVLDIPGKKIVHWFQFAPFRNTKAYDWLIKQGSIEDGYIPKAYGRRYDQFPWRPDFKTEDFSIDQRARAQLEGYLMCGSPIVMNTPNLWKVACELGLGKEYRHWEETADIKEYVKKHLEFKKERGQV